MQNSPVERRPPESTTGTEQPTSRQDPTMATWAMRVTVALASLLIAAPPVLAQSPSTVIRGAVVVDGTGAPARMTDVRITEGRIAGSAQPRGVGRPTETVDGRGLSSRPDSSTRTRTTTRRSSTSRDALAAVSQGITTIVVGRTAVRRRLPSRSASFFARLDTQPVAVNVASYAGHGASGADHGRRLQARRQPR